jgi:hypothetical protein
MPRPARPLRRIVPSIFATAETDVPAATTGGAERSGGSASKRKRVQTAMYVVRAHALAALGGP